MASSSDASGASPWESDVPLLVARNTLMSGALGALTGSIMGVLQAPAVEPAFLAIRMSKIWFAFGFGFFGTCLVLTFQQLVNM